MKKTHKIFSAVLLLAAMSLPALEVSMVSSFAENIHDQFAGLSAGRTPAVPEISRVRPLQRFYIYIFVAKAQTKAGRADVTASLKVKSPEGKIVTVFRKEHILNSDTVTPGSTNLSNLVVNWDFASGDPDGVYSFILDAEDNINKRFSSKELKITLDRTPAEPLKVSTSEIGSFITNFYKAPQPGKLPELFDIFLASDEKARQQKNYSPRPLLYGLGQAIKNDPLLWKEFASRGGDLSSDHKKYLAMIFTAAGDKAANWAIRNAESETAGLVKKMQKDGIWKFRNPLTAEDINALWLSFFFTGKREPVQIIAAELRNRPMLSVRDAKNKKGRLTPQEQLELKNYQANSAASWSLRSHLPNHNLLFYYLEAMLERGEFADQTAASRIQKILTQTAAAASEQQK